MNRKRLGLFNIIGGVVLCSLLLLLLTSTYAFTLQTTPMMKHSASKLSTFQETVVVMRVSLYHYHLLNLMRVKRKLLENQVLPSVLVRISRIMLKKERMIVIISSISTVILSFQVLVLFVSHC